MRIALVTGSWPDLPCGVGDYAARLSQALARRGARVVVVTTRDARVRAGAGGDGPDVRAVMGGWGVTRLPGLAAAVRRARPDVTLLQYPTRGYGRGLAPTLLPRLRVRGGPIAVTLQPAGPPGHGRTTPSESPRWEADR